MGPPLSTTHWISLSLTFCTCSSIRPSSMRMRSPSLTSFVRSWKLTEARVLSPTICSVVRVKGSPSFKTVFPPSIFPRRISGPLVSSSAPSETSISLRSFLTSFNLFRCSSWEPWEKLKRATFMPASIISRSTCSVSLAGPSVQIIFVFLIRSTLLFDSIKSSFSLHKISPTKTISYKPNKINLPTALFEKISKIIQIFHRQKDKILTFLYRDLLTQKARGGLR